MTSTRTGDGTGIAARGSSRSRRKPIKDTDVSKTAAAVSQGSLPHGSSWNRNVGKA
jgi:hypothetical protein